MRLVLTMTEKQHDHIYSKSHSCGCPLQNEISFDFVSWQCSLMTCTLRGQDQTDPWIIATTKNKYLGEGPPASLLCLTSHILDGLHIKLLEFDSPCPSRRKRMEHKDDTINTYIKPSTEAQQALLTTWIKVLPRHIIW